MAYARRCGRSPTVGCRPGPARLALLLHNTVAAFPQESLATLPRPPHHPPALVRAHVVLNKAVDDCYCPAAFPTEWSRLKFRFTAYRQRQAPLLPPPANAQRQAPTSK